MAFQRAELQAWGKRPSGDEISTLPELVCFNATHNGDLVFCLQEEKGGRDLKRMSYNELGLAVQHCSSVLGESIPGLRQGDKLDTVALFLESGINLFVHLVSLLSLGVPVCIQDSSRQGVQSLHSPSDYQVDCTALSPPERLQRGASHQRDLHSPYNYL